jgi:uroporphyrinogen-III synthase
MSKRPLAGRRIAVLEHREQARLGAMLEAQGAATWRCPLVAIADAPDPAPVTRWLQRFVAAPPDDLVLLTGEGLRRLHGFAERTALGNPFRTALARVRTITRGPKPARALRELGLAPGLRAARPTTDGVIAALRAGELHDRRVGVQLYPEAPATLVEFLAAAGAHPEPVSPYVYVPSVDDDRIGALIAELAAGRLDAIAFTSAVQVTRLFAAASAAGLLPTLEGALRRTRVAAVGPVVAAELGRHGLDVAIMPRDTYFMKPLVSAIIAGLAPPSDGSTR